MTTRAEPATGTVEHGWAEALVLQMPAPVALLLGPEHRHALVNDAFRRISGGGRDVTGLPVREAFPELAGQGIYERLDRVYATGEPWAAPESLVRYDRDGAGVRDTWFDVRFVPVRDAAGQVVGILNFAVDVTDQVLARRVVERHLHDSERSRIETARLAASIRASEARYRAIVEQGTAAIAVLEGPEQRYTLVSPTYERWAGQGALTGRTFLEALPGMRDSAFERAHRHVLATGEPMALREQVASVDRDGDGVPEEYVFDVHYAPLHDGAGTVVGVVSQVLDVSEQTRVRRAMESARQAAESARARSDAVLASIGDAFYLVDRDWRFTYVNDAAEPLLQTTRDRLLGRTLWEAFPDVAGSPFEGPYRDAMATGRVTSAEAYFAPLGTWFDVRTYPWSGGLMVHFRDIGPRKAAEAERERLLHALEVERARLVEVFRRAPSFVVVFRGPRHVYEYVNDAYHQLMGHRDLLGKPMLEAVPEIRSQGFDDLLTQVLVTGEPWVGLETPVELQRVPGAPLETRYLDMVFQSLSEADGTRSGVVVHGSDITAQVLARREVERLLGESERARADADAARREAEAANRSKSEFLAVMSHELRTPLNAIGGYAELMEMGIHGPVTAEQRADLERIQQSQRHLLGLINQVLNYTRVDAGAVRYELAAVPAAEALAAAEALVAPQMRARGLSYLVGACPPRLAVRADPEKLQQVLLNLLSNAIKFTEPGGQVRVSCAVGGASVAFAVADTGVGIAPEKLASIFEPFVQVDQRLTRPHEGVGLGLAISRDLARGMGGELTAASTPGVGSTFTLTLPRV